MQSRSTKPATSEMSKVLTRVDRDGSLSRYRMNPLPRILGMALFVVLAALAALLATPVWHAARSAPVATHDPAAGQPLPRDDAPLSPAGGAPRATRIAL